MKVIEAMDRDQFRQVCEMGAETVIAIAEELRERGIEPQHTGNVLLVALAGALKGGDITMKEIEEGLNIAAGMWKEREEGGVLFIGSPSAVPREERD